MTDLERRLQALAADAFPPAPDVRSGVAARIAAAGGETRPRRARRRVIALALALVLVPAAAVAAVPDARDAVLDWLGLAHVQVKRAPSVAKLPPLDRADLGPRVASVAGASRRAGFTVATPRGLGAPDAVYVSPGSVVSLAYGPRPGLPRDPRTGIGVLVTQLRASGVTTYVGKTAGPGTVVERVIVGAAPGIFLSGEPHQLLLEQPNRMVAALPARLAGNTLAFERGDIVIRFEGRFDRSAALALARSLR